MNMRLIDLIHELRCTLAFDTNKVPIPMTTKMYIKSRVLLGVATYPPKKIEGETHTHHQRECGTYHDAKARLYQKQNVLPWI